MPNGKIRFGAIYGTGAVLGFTPNDIKALSMWEFMAALEWYVKANSSDDGKMTSAEVEDVWKWMQGMEG
ncbi:hypothetical protein [Rhizobium sp. BK456]|uniref:hypothetical protein n=1 Tax=Rhizobium sp. BK456 TaxID=2587007 RepID=UPI00160F1FD2|nr:hypothetical protein [Rhizobium sp. BK456]MBB3523080.1 hypothetical protein [Rhizobium sp. BK456]